VEPATLPVTVPVAEHPRLRERERGEDPDHVKVDERLDVGLETDDQRDRERRQDDDAVRVGEAVAEVLELARREVVFRERGESRGKPW
jgi:hypothetical protein